MCDDCRRGPDPFAAWVVLAALLTILAALAWALATGAQP